MGFFNGAGGALSDRYTNPFYGIPQKYIPQNIDNMLKWANVFVIRFGFYRSALSRIANYFITSLSIECEDSEAKKKYKDMLDEMGWKHALGMAGLNYLIYGNLFMTINPGFNRYLQCPKCSKVTNVDKAYDYEFTSKAEFIYSCPACRTREKHQVVDKVSKDVDKLSVIFWNPLEVRTRFDETTNEAEYYWRIPEDYKKKVMLKDNRFYSKKTPKVIYDSILNDRLLSFNDKNFLHIKMPSPVGIKTDGRGIPPCIYQFDDFFMLKVLQRYNEAICFEDIAPFRVMSLGNETNSQANPILTQSSPMWSAAVDKMIRDHRRDPGAYHKFPFPLNYDQLGGKGKVLAPVEQIQQAISNILNAYSIPQELYTMSLQIQTIGPALRLFENSWSVMIDAYNQILAHWSDVIGRLKGLPKAKIHLTPVTISDDMERKSIIGQLVSANAIAKSELLGLYNFDYKEQLKKKQEEDEIQQEMQEDAAAKKQLQQQAQSGGQQGGEPVTPGTVVDQATQIAQQLFGLDGAQRREELQKIRTNDQTLYSTVKQKLKEMTTQAGSQGVQQAQQQGQQ